MRREIKPHLIKSAAEGDAEAFSEIYFALRDPIYGFAYRMLNDAQIAEDIAQEAFIFFIEYPDKYHSERGSLLAFLCGVARNRILGYLKKSETRREISRGEMNGSEDIEDKFDRGPINLLLNKELAAKFEESLIKLSRLQREAIVLRELQELTYEEIAQITGTDANTVKARLYRARRNLAADLEEYVKNKEESYEVL